MKKVNSLLFAIILLMPQYAQSQFLKNLKKAAQDKIEQRVADEITERVAEEIANRAMKSIDKAFDQYLQSSYESETGEKYDPAKFDSLMRVAGEGYVSFIEQLNKSANVPDQYSFDLVLDVETKEGSKESNGQMFLSTTNRAVAFHDLDDAKDMIVVMDPENDVMVMFNKKEMTGQAIPSLFSLTSGISELHPIIDYKLISFENTGKTNKIAGYSTQGYKGETSISTFEGYYSTELNHVGESYNQMINSLTPILYDDIYSKTKGMILWTESIDKETNVKSILEVTKLTETSKTISKSDYKFPGTDS